MRRITPKESNKTDDHRPQSRSYLLAVLLTEELGSADHVAKRGLSLRPLAGLETTVRVNPELLWLEVLEHFLDAVLDLLLAWNTRAVDVVNTWANVAWVGLVDEHFQELGVRLAVLDREDIGIESGNGMEEVLELRVAEVRVDLRGVLNTSSGQLEAVDGPAEVLLTLGARTKRQTLTESRLIDLDDVDASLFKVDNLVTDGKSELLRLDGLVNVITRERPTETGDRTREHTLHWLLADAGGVLALLDRHGSWTGDITNENWWSDAAGAV